MTEWVNQLLLGYHSEGQLDLHVGWYIWKRSEATNNRIRLRVNVLRSFLESGASFDEFNASVDKAALPTKKRLKEVFLESVSADSNSRLFTDLLARNLPYLVQRENRPLRLAARKCLFFGTAVYRGESLKRALVLLARLISHDLYLQVEVARVRRLASDLSDFHAARYKDKTLLLSYPCYDVLRNRLQTTCQMVVPSDVVELARAAEEGFYQVTVLGQSLAVEEQLNYVREAQGVSDIVRVSGKDVEAGEGCEKSGRFGGSNLMVRIQGDSSFTNASLLQVAKIAREQQRRVFWKCSLAGAKGGGLRPGPFVRTEGDLVVFTAKVWESYRKSVLKTVRKFGISGMVVDKALENACWSSVDYQKTEKLDELRERLRPHPRLVPLRDVLAELGLINPFYLSMTRLLHLVSPGFQFVSSEFSHAAKIGWKYLFKPFRNAQIKACSLNGMLNYLNSAFFQGLQGRPISDNFLFAQKKSEDPWKAAILGKFHAFIRTKASFFVVSGGGELFVRRADSDLAAVHQQTLLAGLGTPVFYLPLIVDEAQTNNSVIGCALVAEHRLLVVFEKFFELERSLVDLRVSMAGVYRFLRATLQAEALHEWVLALVSDSATVHLSLYEALKNPMSFKFAHPKFVCKMELVSRRRAKAERLEVLRDTAPLTEAGHRFLAVKRFLAAFKKSASADRAALCRKFAKMLARLKVTDQARLQQLFKLDQVAKNKKNYDIFSLMLAQLAASPADAAQLAPLTAEDIRGHLRSMRLGPIAVITPEYGEFVKVGGLAVMIEDLCNGLVAEGETLHVVLPYYHKDKAGDVDWLAARGVEYRENITVGSRFVNYEIGVHELRRPGIAFHFLHHSWLFPAIYQTVG